MAHHIVSVKTYVAVFLALMVLTALTVAVAFVDFGFANTVIAITIAVVKAYLVVTIFMHLKYSARILWLASGAVVFWFMIMVALTLSDYRSRQWDQTASPWQEAPEQVAPSVTRH